VAGFQNLREDVRRLYSGASDACLAAFKGRAGLWPAAEAAYESIVTPTNLNCIDRAAFQLLERLVDAHRKNPEGVFEADVSPGGTGRPACPTITRVTPDRGQTGTQVTVTGSHFDQIEDVEIEYDNGDVDDSVEYSRNGDSLRLVVRGTGERPSQRACIVLVTEPNWRVTGAPFTFEGPLPTSAPSGPAFACPPD
jgi:hypothetical protein